MSNFSTNFQFNIAQLHSIAKENEKVLSASKNQQERISKRVAVAEEHVHDSVTATQNRNNTNKVKDDKSNTSEERKSHTEEKKNHAQDNSQHSQTDDATVFKDDNKGNVVDLTC